MDNFPVKFTDAHWDQEVVKKSDGGTKTVYFVQELRDAAAAGRPVILVIFGQQDDGTMNSVDFRLVQMFFGTAGPLTEIASGFTTIAMNRLCPCWSKAPWRPSGPMIVLYNHKGKIVKQITSAQYKVDQLCRELQALQELANRAANEKESESGEEQSSGG
jgi:hypothetical protein